MKKLPVSILASSLLAATYPALANEHICSATSYRMFVSCIADLKDDLFEQRAICLNITDEDDAADCRREALDDRAENAQLCKSQRAARRELCGMVGEAAYDMSEIWQPENFVDPNDIGDTVAPNPWFDLTVGTETVFFGAGEIITVVVEEETKLIEGVTCRTVNDLVTEDELDVEDTDDWYAQDVDGNVWYCGEISENYEFFEGDDPEEAELVDIDGSWKGFRDGAQPGILVHASPVPGTTYRQEVAWGEAEDVAMVITLTADGLLEGDECEDGTTTAAVAAHIEEMCDSDCLVNLEYTPIEPDAIAHKYYAPGVGLLAEVEDGECIATRGVIDE